MYVEDFRYICEACGAVFDWPETCDDVRPVRNEYGIPMWVEVCPGCGSEKYVETLNLPDVESITDFEPVISHCSPGNVPCIEEDIHADVLTGAETAGHRFARSQ